jgi:hypothetical protein
MPIHSAVRLAMFAALCSLFVACSKQPENRLAPIPDVNAHASDTGWGNPEIDKGGIPGIDYARIQWYTWNDRLVLAVWLDRWEGSGSRGGGGIGSPGVYEGEFHASFLGGLKGLPDVDVHCTTTDGTTGPITINDEKFDLSQGSLLLVSRSSGKLRTRLLNRRGLPSPDEKGDPKLFEKLKADPEVVAFFNQKKL